MGKQIGDLELEDFDVAPIWVSDVTGCDEETVEPRPDLVSVPDGVHGMWVRFTGNLHDGTPVAGIAMAGGPPPSLMLHSFFIEGEWHSVHFPPAPGFVLAHDGPAQFAKTLGREIDQVFPIVITSDLPSTTTRARIRQSLTVAGPVV